MLSCGQSLRFKYNNLTEAVKHMFIKNISKLLFNIRMVSIQNSSELEKAGYFPVQWSHSWRELWQVHLKNVNHEELVNIGGSKNT